MANEDDNRAQGEHHARIRLTKHLLRYVPRRALFHKYPIVGRFAAEARKRAFLWSFKSAHVRPALYAGSILALQPILGVQLPVAFLCAVLLRLNVMVLGGLQFITNPFTAAPLYYGTYQLGLTVINASGFGDSIEVIDAVAPPEPLPPPAAPAPAVETDPAAANGTVILPPGEIRWTQGLGTSINALVLGGILAGAAVGGFLDLLWRFGASRAEAHRLKVLARRHRSGSTDVRAIAK